MSYTGQICGWLSAATVRASRSKRWRCSGVAGKVWGQHFDRDGAVETLVAGPINLAHAAGADGRENFVWSQMAAGFNCHSVTQRSLTDPARNRERMTGKPEVGFPEATANSA